MWEGEPESVAQDEQNGNKNFKQQIKRQNSAAKQERVFEIITMESIRREQVFTGYSEMDSSKSRRDNFEDMLINDQSPTLKNDDSQSYSLGDNEEERDLKRRKILEAIGFDCENEEANSFLIQSAASDTNLQDLRLDATAT